MESYPKPAPPKPMNPVGDGSTSKPHGTSETDEELPPLYFQHPDDESRIKKVTDRDLAEKLAFQGWILLSGKPKYVPKEHLTESLRNNPALQQMRRDLLREAPQPTQKYSKRPQTKRFSTRRPNSK